GERVRMRGKRQGEGSSEKKKINFKITWFRDKPFWIAFIATLLWATSPVQTQAVTYIVQRAASMATMFYMLSLLCYVKGRVVSGGCRGNLLLCCSALFALLAFGTKEISATLPLIIILYEIYFFARFDPKSIKRISLYAVISVFLFTAIGFVYIAGNGIIEGIQAVTAERKVLQHSFTRITRLMTEFRVIIYYITLLILPLPSRLRFIYEFPISHSLFNPVSTLLCMLIIIGMIGYGIYICKKRPVISFFILWFFINLAIESSIVRLWIVFEHRLYMPSIGFFLIAALCITRLIDIVKDSSRPTDSSDHHNNYWLITVCCSIFVCVILLQSVWTIQRNFIWGDELIMLYDNMKKEPDSSDIPFFIANLYYKEEDFEQAIKYYKESIQIDPYFSSAYYRLGRLYEEIEETNMAIKQYQEAIKYSPLFSDPYINLASLYYEQGKTDKAIRLYKRVKRITQDDKYVYPYVHLGEIYKDQKKWDMAINEYKTAIEIVPEDPILYNELGLLYQKIGKTDLSIEQYQKALEIDPVFSDAHYNLGLISFEQSNFDKALNEFKEALRGNPDYSVAHYNIGVIYYDRGKIELAIREYKKTLDIDPDNPEASYNLAYILQSTGKREEAIRYFERFLETAEKDKYKKFIEKAREQINSLKHS
ncbi:MAG: tetratricopeptide repeat protein, partial [Nitrospirota bacterium]